MSIDNRNTRAPQAALPSNDSVTISREDAMDAVTLFRAASVNACNADNLSSARIFESAAIRIAAALAQNQSKLLAPQAASKCKERIAELEELSEVNSAQIKLLGDWLNARGKSMAELEAKVQGVTEFEKLILVVLRDLKVTTISYETEKRCIAAIEAVKSLRGSPTQQPEKEQGL